LIIGHGAPHAARNEHVHVRQGLAGRRIRNDAHERGLLARKIGLLCVSPFCGNEKGEKKERKEKTTGMHGR